MGKGSRNRDYRGFDQVDAPQKYKTNKKKKRVARWLKPAISIAITVILVLGIVAGIMASNGTFRRMQILVKSQTGEFNVNRQVATFLAWELEYYSAYIDYLQTSYSDPDATILTQYSSADSFAMDYATARVTDEILDANGVVISSPRDSIENTLAYMINFVAVCDYAYGERGITVEDAEWQGDITITWLSGMEDTIPVSWTDLRQMQVSYGFASMDLFLDTFFGNGLKAKDVEQAFKLIALYEKYMAIHMEEVKNGTNDTQIMDYILNNPGYFYTADYLNFKTTDAALKDKLAAATDIVDFKRIIADDWYNNQDGYKDIYNQYVTLKAAEKDYDFVEDKVDNDNGTAWSDAIAQIGAEKVTYLVADKDDTTKIAKELSRWLFATRKQFDDNLIVTDDKIYVVSFVSSNKDDSGNLESVTVYQKAFDMVSGEEHDGDTAFKETILAHMLAKKEFSTEPAPSVIYQTALQNATALKDKWVADAVTEEDLIKADGVMAGAGELTHKDECVKTSTKVPSVIRDAIFKADAAHAEKSFLVVEESDTVAYVVYLKNLVVEEGETAGIEDATWNIYYVEIESDVFYQILEAVCEEVDDALPKEREEYFTATPTEGSYQQWMFKDANKDNGFKSPIEINDKTVITDTKTNADGQTEDTYTVYFLVRGLHLDDEKLVNGGYYVFKGDDTSKVFDVLKDKTGADLIAALQSLEAAEGKTNNAVISDQITTEKMDKNLADWLTADERVANEFAVVNGEDGKTYVAVYLDHSEMWEEMGLVYRSSEVVNNWLAERSAQYQARQWVLNLIGDPTPVATTPAA